MNLQNFILFIFEPNLKASTLNVNQIEPSDIVALELLQSFLVIHR